MENMPTTRRLAKLQVSAELLSAFLRGECSSDGVVSDAPDDVTVVGVSAVKGPPGGIWIEFVIESEDFALIDETGDIPSVDAFRFWRFESKWPNANPVTLPLPSTLHQN
jgi:hypothetical protein